MQDGEYILGELGLGAGIRLVENHDCAAVLLDQPLDEFKAESGQPVPMGNHNIEFIAAMQSFQYGDKSLTASVELTGNVVGDFHVGMEP